jgi:hypothetical protein
MMQVFPKIINDNFYKWFDSSKAIDGNGKCQIYYHKSRSKELFEVFKSSQVDKNLYNDSCYGFYFVGDYHKSHVEYMGDGVEYYVFLNYKNPFYIYDNGLGEIKDMEGNLYPFLDINKTFCENLELKGYDSIIIECHRYYSQYIVFHSHQIKSIDNNGDYSNDLNIFK